ncbi:hypothetical protein [Amycolatopsis sp. NPDC051128]|uniref:hypothetical protein n=1 Tax=Amycolatopsis sp. NPDC051128 TaxID=3155412 RepID=UPI00344665DB
MDKRNPQLTMTPTIQYAITVLRAATPQRDRKAGAIGISAGFDESGFDISAVYPGGRSGTSFAPTDEQVAATCLLASVFGLHQAALRRAWGIADDNDRDETYPPQYHAAVKQLRANSRRTAKVEGSQFYYYDRRLHGSVTVYL